MYLLFRYLGEMELYSKVIIFQFYDHIYFWLIYYHFYPKAIFACIWISIIVLTIGVVILSSKPPEKRPRSNSKVDMEAGEFEVSALGQPEENAISMPSSASQSPSPAPHPQHKDDERAKAENIELSALRSKSMSSDDDREEEAVLIDSTKGTEKTDLSEDTEQWTLGEGSDDEK